MIKCLSEEVQASLRSGVAITSLGQCVEELVFNSIDAKATCVAIRVDLETFKIQVVDNGSGMGREDLQTVGNRYFTSKCYSVEDLENLTFYGFRGEALASITSIASIVEISSKTSKIAKTFLKVFHNGKGLEVSEAELNRPSTGTTMTVYNLFHQLPVRRKCMDSILEFERVRHKVEALSLMHPSVSFSLRNDASCSTVLQLPKTKDVCSRFSQIYGLGKSQKLREIYHKSGGFEISGYISSQGHYNKSIQFLYVNRRQVLKTRVHKLIDFLLRKQSTICKTKPLPVTSSPAHHRSGSELNGVFVINVKCQHDEYDVCLEPAKTLIEFRSWDALLLCIEEGVKAFLKREHLFIEPCGEDVKEFNENNGFCLSSAMAFQPSLPEEKHMQENFRRACDNIVDSYEMFNLQSKSVRRKITLEKETSDHTGPTNNVKETAALPDLTITEPVCESSSKVKNPLPNKKDTTRDLPKLGNLHKEPNVCDDPQTEVVNSKCPQEGCGQSLSYALEKDNSLCSEMCVKDAKCLHGPAFQEGSPSSATLGPTENVRDVNACKHPFLLKRALVGKYGNAKEGKRPPMGLNSHGEAAVREESLKLSSTGLIVHLMQHQPPDKTADINHSVNIPPILGPVSARDIFDKNLRFSGQTSSTQKYLRMTKGSVYTGNARECMEIGNVSDQKEEMNSLPAVGSGGDFVTPNIKELISIVPSSSVHNVDNATSKKQMAKNLTRFRHCTFTKLSLHPKLGSLERFRQHYGSIKNTQSRTTKNVDEFAVPSCVGSLTDKNTNLEHSSNCEIPVGSNNNVECNNNGHDCPPPLEESQLSTEERVLSTYVRESPLTLTDYSQSRTEAPSSRFTGTLSSKVSRMKGSLKETVSLEPRGQPSEQSQVHSSPKNEGRCGLLSQNNLLQRNDPISQFSTREEGTKSHSFTPYSPEQGNPMEISNTKAVDTEDTVSLCFIDSDGEYVVSQKRSLVMDNKEVCSEDTCEDTSAMDGTSKQSMNTCELPIEGLSSTSEAATDGGGLAQNEESQFHPSEWIHQFDASLGRTVYINRMTGLSTYCTPPSEEPKAICTKDISTMAVNVMENGFQCRCHPFRSEFIVPFLPRPQKERHLASQDFRDAQGESLQSLFSDWDNPVFARCPEVALDVSSGKADNLAVKIHNILYPYRFTKDMIESMQVLNQVDNKFIACLISTRAGENKEIDGNLLVLVDQHAAHERIRLEQLIIDSYEKQTEASGKKKLLASTVCPPLEIEITEEQRRLLWCCHKSLEDLGLELAFPEDNPLQILVGKVPLCFVEREANELRRGRQTVAKSIVEEFIREQVELLQTARGARGTFPLTILKVLASQACHGAIKFNDGLTLEESCHLMKALSCCQLPFQCAHGRPSMLPLADTDHLQQESQPKPNLAKLRRMAKAWQHFRKEKTPLEKHDPHLSSSTSTTSHLALAPCISSPAPPPLEHKSVRPTWQP